MQRWKLSLFGSLLLASAAAQAATFTFNDSFAPSDALTTPGRQIVGGEPSISFDAASDAFVFQSSALASGPVSFANGVISDVPTTGTNVVVLRTFDNDNNPATPFGAGTAATLIADRITTSGPGLFVYFNSGLDLPRLVYSTNLSDSDADLKILARMTNLAGAAGQQALQQFGADDFAFVASPVPEPSTLLMLGSGAALLAFVRRKRGRNQRPTA